MAAPIEEPEQRLDQEPAPHLSHSRVNRYLTCAEQHRLYDAEDHEAALSDQLTAYALAEPEAQQVALCILVKTKEPRIEWHFAKRGADALAEYLDKVRLVSDDIAAGKFYKRPGKHCAWCDFLPMCLGDKKKAQDTLVRIA